VRETKVPTLLISITDSLYTSLLIPQMMSKNNWVMKSYLPVINWDGELKLGEYLDVIQKILFLSQ
jgi:hypothetical protein